MSLFIPITKVDVTKQLVYGTLSEEIPDKAGEILDYDSAKPAFLEWSEQSRQASGGKSLGNVRAMHGAIAAGKLTDIHFDDATKRIAGVAKIVDADEWKKVLEGVYTGFSIGGGYARRWPDSQNPELMRYTPTLSEVSLVDNPAVPTATFEIIKQDGTSELRKFSFARDKSNVQKQFHSNPSAHEVSMIHTDAAADNRSIHDDYDLRIENLLEDLKWLAGEAEDNGDDELLEHIQQLQACLDPENSDAGEEDEDDNEATDGEDDTSSHAYASELAHLQRSAGSYVRPHKQLYESYQAKKEIVELQKRITQLEAQPMPAKGALRLVGKNDDRETVGQSIEKLPPADRVRELMKIALSQPVEA